MSKKQATCVQCNKTYSHTSDLSLRYCSWGALTQSNIIVYLPFRAGEPVHDPIHQD